MDDYFEKTKMMTESFENEFLDEFSVFCSEAAKIMVDAYKRTNGLTEAIEYAKVFFREPDTLSLQAMWYAIDAYCLNKNQETEIL